jgi:hypothetical protein
MEQIFDLSGFNLLKEETIPYNFTFIISTWKEGSMLALLGP